MEWNDLLLFHETSITFVLGVLDKVVYIALMRCIALSLYAVKNIFIRTLKNELIHEFDDLSIPSSKGISNL
jgi:hypothetical protein